ncbi:hypothetical protein IFR04_009979 [Cadophora malorum]|uniref:Uncharacterized protein n=1 Tax=Cadophora malorum TaxID=108018 RepID=A0A8H7TDK6_9HELO|nr:hypothetical protein IFR04_009979 [Cadophora malorum]
MTTPIYSSSFKSKPWYHISFRTIVLVSLPLFSLAGFYGTMILANGNGTFKSIISLMESKDPKFPGTEDDLLIRYTNVGWLDRQLTILVTFFAPVVDEKQGALSMFARFGTGQFGAAWTLMVMEGMRMGNMGRIVSFVGTFGLIFQNISYTVTVPIWLFIHLLTSPISKPFSGTHSNSILLISPLDLRLLPFSVTLSYIVPTILMALDYPSTVTTLTHQRLIALWQPFPLWTILVHYTLKTTLSTLSSSSNTTKNNTTSRLQSSPGTTYLKTAKHIYRFTLTICILSHLPILLLSLLPPTLIPSTYPSLHTMSQESPLSVYIPPFPSPSSKISSLAEGVHTFLIWDVYIGSFAFLLWGMLMYRNAVREKVAWMGLLGKVGVWCVLGGPIGALTVLLRERDGLVMGEKVKKGE